MFRIDYDIQYAPDGEERHVKHYYATESVGIAWRLAIADDRRGDA